MTQWTDERIAALLTDAFAAHESDADPAVAQRIAVTTAPQRRRRWPLLVAVAAIVVLVAGVTAYVLRTPDPTPRPMPATVPPTAGPTASVALGANRALAQVEARTLLATIPVPPGAMRSDDAPADRLRRLGVYGEPLDPSLTRTAWWVVPLSYTDLVDWYAAHSPADVSSAYTDDGASSPVPGGDLSWTIPSRAPSSYSDPTAVVSYARLGPDSTAIRTDATLAARVDRTADTFVPASATGVDVTRSAPGGPDVDRATVTDPAVLARIVAAFNELPGAFVGADAQACGSPTGEDRVYALTFHWPGHTLAVDAGNPLCGIGMGLTLDGTALPQGLEDQGRLDAILDDAIEGS